MEQNQVITTNSEFFPNLKAFKLRGIPVMLASDIAKVFERRTASYVQNFTRHLDIFDEKYAFQTTDEEVEKMVSLGVTPSKKSLGGHNPWVVSRKGIMLSIAKMNTKKAMKTLALLIDVLDEVLEQLYHGENNIEISTSSKLLPTKYLVELEQINNKILKAIDNLLNTEIDKKNKTTIKDEMGEIGQEAINHVKEWLKGKQISNEKVEAETVLILEKARDISERRQSELEDAVIEREHKLLIMIEKRIDIIEKLINMKERLEPNAIVNLVGNFGNKNLIENK